MSDPVQTNAGGGTPPAPAIITYGKNYAHGIDDATISALNGVGMDPTEVKASGEPEFMTEAKGPKGLVAAILKSPKKITLNISGFVLDEQDFDAAEDFTLGGRFFIIGKDDKTFVGDDFTKAEFTATSYPGITGKTN